MFEELIEDRSVDWGCVLTNSTCNMLEQSIVVDATQLSLRANSMDVAISSPQLNRHQRLSPLGATKT